MKKAVKISGIYICILSLFFGGIGVLFADWNREIEECLHTENYHQISDYTCLAPGRFARGERVLQVTFDLEMQKVDDEVEEFLYDYLSEAEWASGIEHIAIISQLFDNISGIPDNFYNKYIAACRLAVEEAEEYLEWFTQDNRFLDALSCNDPSKDTVATLLIERKLTAYREAAFLISSRSLLQWFTVANFNFIQDTRNAGLEVLRDYGSLNLKYKVFEKKWDRVIRRHMTGPWVFGQ